MDASRHEPSSPPTHRALDAARLRCETPSRTVVTQPAPTARKEQNALALSVLLRRAGPGNRSRECRYGWGLSVGAVGTMRGVSRLDRITVDPAICHGKPTVRGLRYPVQSLLELLASGMTIDEILDDYPDLERDDVLAALEFGAKTAGSRRVPLGAA